MPKQPNNEPKVIEPAIVTPTEPSLDQLKAQLVKAAAEGNDTLFEETLKAIGKFKSEIASKAAAALKAEAEKLAGVRQTLATAIHQAVKSLGLDSKLQEVKALGFTYNLDHPDVNGVMTEYKSVSLMVPSVKTKRSGGGGGGQSGKSKDEYGISLAEIYDKFKDGVGKVKALDMEDVATVLEASVAGLKDTDAKNYNSKMWQIKVAVKKAAIAQGLLQPVK